MAKKTATKKTGRVASRILGIDVGATGLKAGIINGRG
jgi:hypothetical protein